MAGITTIDSVMSRIRKLVRYYIDAEVDLIDTRNNALAAIDSDTDNSFTTASIPSADVQLYRDDRKGEPIRIVIEDEGLVNRREGFLPTSSYSGAEPTSTMPRLDRAHRINIRVLVNTSDAADTLWGARRRCNRVADAVTVIMARFIDLPIPGQTIAGLDGCGVEMVGDTKADWVEEDSWKTVERVLSYDVRLIEHRA